MMTSINPKNVNMTNLQQNKVDIAPNPVNSLFQRNNYVNEGINSNMNYNQNLNINQIPQNKMYNKNINPEIGGDNMMKNMNMNMNNLNYNTQNNSINLNLGLQNKKNYSTPILNEISNAKNIQNQDKQDYNKSMDMYERNIQNNNNILSLNQPQNLNNELYLAEIDRLKKEINDLKKNNEILNSQLIEEQRKNEQLFSIQKAKDENENSILGEIAHCLQVASFDEILPKLNEIINYLNNNVNSNNTKNKNQEGNNKIRDELISKLQNLYLSLTGSDEKKEEVTIKILWRWIKHLINTVKQLALEKEKNLELYQNINEIDECKEFCEDLMSGLNLQSLDELKMVINNLLNQNNNMNNNQPQMRNMPMEQNMVRQQFQPKGPVQNYQQEEENEEMEGDEQEQEQEQEGIDEGDENDAENENENDNMDPTQQQYENENDYEEQIQMNEQNNQNDDNYQ